MKECAKFCLEKRINCPEKSCRLWINFKIDHNCTLIAISKNDDGLTLEECAKRLDMSIGSIKKIQDNALQKMNLKLVQNENF